MLKATSTRVCQTVVIQSWSNPLGIEYFLSVHVCIQLCCTIWKFLAGTSRLGVNWEPALCMTAWTPRELVGWRNMVLKGPNTLSLQGKVRITDKQQNTQQHFYYNISWDTSFFIKNNGNCWLCNSNEDLKKTCVCLDLLSLDQSKTFYKPDWFDIVGAEVKCCKEAVCVIDMSSFTKFELTVSLVAP